MAFPTKSLDLEQSSSQYALISDASQTGLDITGNFTIEVWVKLEALPSTGGADFAVVNKLANSAIGGYRLNITAADKVLCSFINASDQVSQVQTTSAAFDGGDVGVWRHLAVSVTVASGSAGIIVYKDGSSLSTTSDSNAATTVGNNTKNFSVGASNTDTTPAQFFDGKMVLMRVWSSARTQGQITGNWCTVLGATTGLQAEWTFDNVYTDDSGNSNTLTPTNSPVFSSDVPALCAVVGPANLKSLDGNLKANIKSFDGNLIANIKSIDGNA